MSTFQIKHFSKLSIFIPRNKIKRKEDISASGMTYLTCIFIFFGFIVSTNWPFFSIIPILGHLFGKICRKCYSIWWWEWDIRALCMAEHQSQCHTEFSLQSPQFCEETQGTGTEVSEICCWWFSYFTYIYRVRRL